MKHKKPNNDKEHIKLGEYLSRMGGPIQNAEALDGFFAALICCQDSITPDDFMHVLLNVGPQDDIPHFANEKDAKQFFKLVGIQWGRVSHQICEKGHFLPLVLFDEDGKFHANHWAHGFLEGAGLRYDMWIELLKDETKRHLLSAIWALADEHQKKPKIRFIDTITDQQRGQLYFTLGYCVTELYRHFSKRKDHPPKTVKSFTRPEHKAGRNDPCVCGSGKKFKHCCGRRSLRK